MCLLFILANSNTNAQKSVSNPRLEADMERASVLLPWDDANKRIKENVFVKVIANKNSCYVGEPLLVTYKLFTRLQSHSKVVDAPAFTGCSVIEMTTNDLKEEKEVINGRLFKTFVIRKVQILPLQEGPLTLGEVTVDNTINLFQTSNGRLASTEKQARLTNAPLIVTVKPLPTDSTKPAISAVVGKFFMIGKVVKSVDTANDNNSLELTITGSGNFMNMSCPSVKWPTGIQAYEPKVSEMLDKLAFPVLGEKKFTIPFTCKHQGQFSIPAISFTYFDADSGRFVSSSIDTIQLKVLAEVPIVDPEKVSVGITNLEYLWIIPAIAAVVGLVMLYFSYNKKKRSSKNQAASTYEEAVEKKNALVESRIVHRDRLADLTLNKQDTNFYKEAKELAIYVLECNLMDDRKQELSEVISLCNEALYAFKESDKEYILATLSSEQ